MAGEHQDSGEGEAESRRGRAWELLITSCPCPLLPGRAPGAVLRAAEGTQGLPPDGCGPQGGVSPGARGVQVDQAGPGGLKGPSLRWLLGLLSGPRGKSRLGGEAGGVWPPDRPSPSGGAAGAWARALRCPLEAKEADAKGRRETGTTPPPCGPWMEQSLTTAEIPAGPGWPGGPGGP